MAKAYYAQMKERGFVFVRLDDVKDEILQKAEEICHQFLCIIDGCEKNKRYISNTFGNKKISSLITLSKNQLDLVCQTYAVQNNKKSTPYFGVKDDLFRCECKLYKALFELYNLEENKSKRDVISKILNDRLDFFG